MTPLFEPHLTEAHKRAAIAQIESGWIGPGEANARFAEALGKMHGRHCTLTNSGTSALMLAYLALGLKPGDTVACPDYGLPACHNAARLLGLKVALIDVDPSTGCMDPCDAGEDIFNSVGSRYSAVVYVEHNGQVDGAIEAASLFRGKVPFIEDAAVALGCPGIGRVGDMSIFSFSVPKIITTGQGGAVLSARADIAERLAELVDQGGHDWRKDRVHRAVGGNFRMPDVLAAMGEAQLVDLPLMLERRAQLWDWYREGMEIGQDVRPSGWMVTARARDRAEGDRIIEAVNAAGYEARRLYQPVHRNPPYEAPDSLFPGACELYDRLVYLPSSLNLTWEQVREVTRAVARGRG